MKFVPYVGTLLTLYELYELYEEYYKSSQEGGWILHGEGNHVVPAEGVYGPDFSWRGAGDAGTGYPRNADFNHLTRTNFNYWPPADDPIHTYLTRLRPVNGSNWKRAIRSWYRDHYEPGYPGNVRSLPMPATRPLPNLDPWELPIGKPVYVTPLPYKALPYRPEFLPHRAPSERSDRGHNREPRLATRFHPRKPGRNVRERKVRSNVSFVLLRIRDLAGDVTEALDIVDAIYNSLPDDIHNRIRHADVKLKLTLIYENWDRIDIEQAAINILTNEVQDLLIGKSVGAIDHSSFGSRPLGITAGPAI